MPKASGVYKTGNGTWYFKLFHSKDPETGKWKQATRRGFASAADAAAARQAMADELAGPTPRPGARRVTVSQLIERYHADADAMGQLSERTLYDQQGYVRNYITPDLGEAIANDLSAAQVRAWLVKLATTGGRGGKPLSANTIRLARSLLLKAFAYG